MEDENERPSFKASIHGHPVYCDDQVARDYLRKLDSDEAEVIFNHAKNSGSAEFEITKGSSRYNYSMEYDDGAYLVTGEGRESSGGWF